MTGKERIVQVTKLMNLENEAAASHKKGHSATMVHRDHDGLLLLVFDRTVATDDGYAHAVAVAAFRPRELETGSLSEQAALIERRVAAAFKAFKPSVMYDKVDLGPLAEESLKVK